MSTISIKNKFILVLFIMSIGKSSFAQGSIQQNGMKVSWIFEKDEIKFTATAPTEGWLALGFNTSNKLAGNNLIMGASEFDFFKMDDRFIVGAGDHRLVTAMANGQDRLSNRSVTQGEGKTTMSFSLPIISKDNYHHNLLKGSVIYLLIAYSVSDDFQHHSRMRTTVTIKL